MSGQNGLVYDYWALFLMKTLRKMCKQSAVTTSQPLISRFHFPAHGLLCVWPASYNSFCCTSLISLSGKLQGYLKNAYSDFQICVIEVRAASLRELAGKSLAGGHRRRLREGSRGSRPPIIKLGEKVSFCPPKNPGENFWKYWNYFRNKDKELNYYQ